MEYNSTSSCFFLFLLDYLTFICNCDINKIVYNIRPYKSFCSNHQLRGYRLNIRP